MSEVVAGGFKEPSRFRCPSEVRHEQELYYTCCCRRCRQRLYPSWRTSQVRQQEEPSSGSHSGTGSVGERRRREGSLFWRWRRGGRVGLRLSTDKSTPRRQAVSLRYDVYVGMNGYAVYAGMNGYAVHVGMNGYAVHVGMNGYAVYVGMNGYAVYAGMHIFLLFM